MTELVQLTLFITIPLFILRRGYASGGAVVFNFTLYPLLFSYFYLLLPSAINVFNTVDYTLKLTSASLDAVDLLSFWTVGVFFAGYALSREPALDFNRGLRLARLTVSLARLAQLFVTVATLFILAKHGPHMIQISADRAYAYDYYSREIIDAYKLPVLFAFSVVSCSILFVRTRRAANLLPLTAFIILDALHGGRGYTLGSLIVIFSNYLATDIRKFRWLSLAAGIAVVTAYGTAFVRRYVSTEDTSDPLVVFFGEFLFTRMTAQFGYDTFTSQGDLSTYLLVSASKLLPQFLVAPLFSEADLTPYHVILNSQTGINFGLAGSILAESLYYGGTTFAVVSPIIVGSIFLLLNRARVIASLPGYLFFLVACSSMHIFFRAGFYTNFFSLCYMFIFYFSAFILPSARAKVFHTKRVD